MRVKDASLRRILNQKILAFDQGIESLPGITDTRQLECLVAQMIDSIRRIKYVETIRDKTVSNIYSDPTNPYFDPIKAASWHRSQGSIDEAFWLIFLATHFGKNKKTGWKLVKEIYGGDGSGGLWTWNRTCMNFIQFRDWLNANNSSLRAVGKFGNHRKYQSLDAFSPTGTGMAIGSYIDWVGPNHSHLDLMQDAINIVGHDSRLLFNYLYDSMNQVVSFGRTARFDYLTMIGKMGLATIVPPFTYMEGATGPKRGAKLLFTGNPTSALSDALLNQKLTVLEAALGLSFGMQVLEDALCNWQKSPTIYSYFGG